MGQAGPREGEIEKVKPEVSWKKNNLTTPAISISVAFANDTKESLVNQISRLLTLILEYAIPAPTHS